MQFSFQRTFQLLGYALVGGLCSFAWGFLMFPFLPAEAMYSVGASLAPGILALIGAIAALIFLKKPHRVPVFLFFVGFIFMSKFFEGMFVTLDRIL